MGFCSRVSQTRANVRVPQEVEQRVVFDRGDPVGHPNRVAGRRMSARASRRLAPTTTLYYRLPVRADRGGPPETLCIVRDNLLIPKG